MAEMTSAQLTEYLKQVSSLETSVYKQTEIQKQAMNDLSMPIVYKKQIEKPPRQHITAPTAPTFAFSDVGNYPIANGIALLALLSGFVCGILFEGEGFIAYLICLAVAVATMLVSLFRALLEYRKNVREYPAKLVKYNQACEKNAREYEEALLEYKYQSMIAEKQFAAETSAAHYVYQLASDEVAKLDGPLQETKTLLEQIYSADIIFQKYRNMVAMCTMYEYFASGRCTELVGPTGAYNLYEAELRQNLIINQLELVNENIEQVKQNQFVLYQSISETNQLLSGVSADIKGILSMSADIAASSRITAFCSQVTAANAQAQTYLAIMD